MWRVVKSLRPGLLAALLALPSCHLVLEDDFAFRSNNALAGGQGGEAGSAGQGGEAGSAGPGGGAGASGATDCPAGGEAQLRLANLLDNKKTQHICAQYPGETRYFLIQSAVHGFPDGLPPATVTRYHAMLSGEFSVGLDDTSSPQPCLAPTHVQKVCVPPDAHATLMIAGNSDDPGLGAPAFQLVRDIEPKSQKAKRSYIRSIHAVAPTAAASPWLDVMVWTTISTDWVLPFRDLKFREHPTTLPKPDPSGILPLNELGYIEGLVGLPLVSALEVILPLTLELGGQFAIPSELITLITQRPSVPVTVLLWGNLRPDPGAAPEQRFPGLRLLACLDEPEPALGAVACFDLPRAPPGALHPLPQVRLGNLTPESTRFCVLPYSASNAVVSRGSRPGWSEMSPNGIVVEPFSIQRERTWPHDDYMVTNVPLSQSCADVYEMLLAADINTVDGCWAIPLSCGDLSIGAPLAQPVATVLFDGAKRHDFLLQPPVQPGLVSARLVNLMAGSEALRLAPSGGVGEAWPEVAPSNDNYDVPIDTKPVFVQLAPQPAGPLSWQRGEQQAVSVEPASFCSQADRSFTLWAAGDAASLGDSASPQAPFVLVCDNEATDATLACQRLSLTPQAP